MAYRTMRSMFHEGTTPVDEELHRRLNLAETVRLGFSFGADELFFTVSSDVFRLLLKAARLDKEISKLSMELPPRAVSSYTDSCLIDEIVLTNNIEGVHSTRREISEVLDSLKERDRSGRFAGLVHKYVMLSSGLDLPLSTCEDIRALYDELVLDEVVEEDPENRPDGALFRAGTVDVCDGAGRVVHSGVHPESLIIEDLEKSLRLLNDDSVEPLVRAAVFHYLFGHIHPFYDGNGRMNRFISSHVLSQHYEPIVGLRLSFAIKEHINTYYKAYTTCEHALNRGDLTPFVIAFCEIAVAAMESMRNSLAERLDSLEKYSGFIEHSQVCADRQTREVALHIVSATLFSAYGLTPAQLTQILNVSRQTVYKRVEPLKAAGWLVTTKVGRKTYYTLDLDKLAE